MIQNHIFPFPTHFSYQTRKRHGQVKRKKITIITTMMKIRGGLIFRVHIQIHNQQAER